jgi:hypothetical protein
MPAASSAELVKMIALTGTVQEDANFGKNGPGDAGVQAGDAAALGTGCGAAGGTALTCSGERLSQRSFLHEIAHSPQGGQAG